jgi:hypothetical protein
MTAVQECAAEIERRQRSILYGNPKARLGMPDADKTGMDLSGVSLKNAMNESHAFVQITV